MNIFQTKHPLIALPAAALLLAASSSFAQSVGEPPALQCDFKSTQRLLTVVYPELEDGGGCRVIYEKPDEGIPSRVLWRASNDLEFCTRKLNLSAGKLVASGWTCSQREDAIAYSIQLAAALPAIEGDAAAAPSAAPAAPEATAATVPTAAPMPVKPSVAPPPVLTAQPTLPAKETMATPDADRVLPEKDTASSLATRSNTAEPQKQAVIAKAPASSLTPKTQAAQAPVKSAEKAAAPVRTRTNDGEYDDWLFRWDEISKQLVFTLYNSKDGTKVHNFSWVHDQMDQSAASPSNIVLAQDEHSNQVLIIAWPGKDSQHITVLDPLVKERPVCEIETQSTRDSDWGYGVEEKKLFLKGFKPSAGDPAKLVEFREQCTYVR